MTLVRPWRLPLGEDSLTLRYRLIQQEFFNGLLVTLLAYWLNIAVPIQMRYNIISPGVGARHCRAPTGVPHVNENRYISD
ncbi:hypothetical protein [Nostoc sp.]|uniref:hypothetical protein n=1 Tax=Nostoc sp. TaxID=1180 RepID=UPI002FFB2FA3